MTSEPKTDAISDALGRVSRRHQAESRDGKLGPGQGAVAAVQVKGAKDLLSGIRDRREQMERHFRRRVDSRKGLIGCGKCLGVPDNGQAWGEGARYVLGAGALTVRAGGEVESPT